MNLGLIGRLLDAGVVTVEVALGAWILGSILGLIFAILRHLGGLMTRTAVSSTVILLRAVPQLVLLYLIYFGLPVVGIQLSSLVAAIIALGVAESAFTAEYFRAGLQTVAATQGEAGESLGLSRLRIFSLIIAPQGLIVAVPALLNSLIGLLKLATLASAVGAPEILYQSQIEMSRFGNLSAIAATVVLIYILVTLPGIRVVRRLERRISRMQTV